MKIDIVTATSIGINVLLAFITLISVRVSVQAKNAAKQSADAADRQAAAAEEQVKAIPAQLAAANLSAVAAKQQADLALQTAQDAKRIAQLSETQLKVSLRPIIEFERRPPTLRDPVDYIVNKGQGIAYEIRVGFRTNILPPPPDIPPMLAGGGESITRVDWARAKNETISITYKSEDGRAFQTLVSVNQNWHPQHVHNQLP